MTGRLTVAALLTAAGRALWKVDRLGPRGATCVSTDEIEALAGVAALAGVVPLAPGEAPAASARHIPAATTEGDTA